MGRKLAGWALLAFLLFFILSNPTGAAVTARHVGSWLAGAGTSIGHFVTALTSGGGR